MLANIEVHTHEISHVGRYKFSKRYATLVLRLINQIISESSRKQKYLEGIVSIIMDARLINQIGDSGRKPNIWKEL